MYYAIMEKLQKMEDNFKKLCDQRKLYWHYTSHSSRKFFNKLYSKNTAEKNGVLVPKTLLRFDQTKEALKKYFVNPDNMYVAKPVTGHSARNVFVVNNGIDLFSNKKISPEEIYSIYKKKNLNGFIEEFIPLKYGSHEYIESYKVFYFNQKFVVRVNCDIFDPVKIEPKTIWQSFYDENWSRILGLHSYAPEGPDIAKPKNLSQLLKYAQKLGELFDDFVRVDFYNSRKGWVFGEFSPYPFNGEGFTEKGDKLFSTLWKKAFNTDYTIKFKIQILTSEHAELYTNTMKTYLSSTYTDKRTIDMDKQYQRSLKLLKSKDHIVYAVLNQNNTEILSTTSVGSLRYKSGLNGICDSEIFNAYVHPFYRGKGLFGMLDKASKKELLKRGFNSPASFVISKNKHQTDYYKSINAKRVLVKKSSDWENEIHVFKQNL